MRTHLEEGDWSRTLSQAPEHAYDHPDASELPAPLRSSLHMLADVPIKRAKSLFPSTLESCAIPTWPQISPSIHFPLANGGHRHYSIRCCRVRLMPGPWLRNMDEMIWLGAPGFCFITNELGLPIVHVVLSLRDASFAAICDSTTYKATMDRRTSRSLHL